MSKYIIEIYTPVPESIVELGAIADTLEEVEDIAEAEAEFNSTLYDFYDHIAMDLFEIPNADDLTDEQWEKVLEVEEDYWGFEITEVTTPELEKKFDTLELIYES